MDALLIVAGLALVAYALAAGAAGAAVPALLGPSLNPAPVSNSPFGPVTLSPAQASTLQLIGQYGGDWAPADLMAVVEIESAFDPAAFLMDRNGGSYGLMQLDLIAAQQVGYAGDGPGLFDPATNIQLGCAYLDWITNYLGSRLTSVSTSEVIAAYNAGVGAVAKGYQDVGYVGRWQAARNRWVAALQQGVA